MYEQQIQQIKESLREIMQLLVSRGQPINNEIRRAVAQAMEHAAERISQLRAEEAAQLELEEAEDEQEEIADELPPETGPVGGSGGPIPPLEPAPHESSNINAFRYDPESQKLFVKFQDKYPHQNGPVYSYEGVPKNIYEVFRRGAVAPRTSGSNAWHTWKEGVTPSHGASMYALIREGGYPYQRLS